MVSIEIRKLDENNTILNAWRSNTFDNFEYTINTPVTPTPLPEEDQTENILIKIEGNSASVNLSFVVKDSPTNTITNISQNTQTLFQQIEAVRHEFRPVSINDAFQIALVDDDTDLITWRGTIVKIRFGFQSTEPVSCRASVQFLEGNVVTQYNTDGAKQPTNLSARTGSVRGTVNLTWTNPTDTGTGNPAIRGFRVEYHTIGVFNPIYEETTSTSENLTISGLNAGVEYQFRVAVISGDSRIIGQYSDARFAVAGT